MNNILSLYFEPIFIDDEIYRHYTNIIKGSKILTIIAVIDGIVLCYENKGGVYFSYKNLFSLIKVYK